MIKVCSLTGFKYSNCEVFPNIVIKELHPFFSISEEAFLKLANKKENFSFEEKLLAALFPFIKYNKILTSSGSLLDALLSSKGVDNGQGLSKMVKLSFGVVKGLNKLSETDKNKFLSEVPKFRASSLNSLSFLRENLNSLMFQLELFTHSNFSIKIGKDELMPSNRFSKLALEDSSIGKSFLDSYTMEDHLITLLDAMELTPEQFTLTEKEVTFILGADTKDLANSEWASKINILQDTLTQVLEFHGANALGNMALLKYMNGLIDLIVKFKQVEGLELNISDALAISTTYKRKGVNVKLLEVDDISSLVGDVELVNNESKVATSANDRLRKLLLAKKLKIKEGG